MSLESLFKMQQVELKIRSVEKQLDALAKDTETVRLKEEYHKLKAAMDRYEAMKTSNCTQMDAKNNEIKNLKKDKGSMEEMKYSRETDAMKKLESVDKQIVKLDEKLDYAENHMIKLMEEGENIDESLNETKKKMSFIKRKYLGVKEAHEKSRLELSESRKALASELDKIHDSIDHDEAAQKLLDIYQKLQKRFADPVSSVINRRCTGCNVEMAMMDYEALRSGKGILRCESCGRLLLFRS